MDADVYESNFCPVTTLSANNTFLTPTGPTLLIVRHLTLLIVSTHCEARDPAPGRFPSTHLTKCCLSICGGGPRSRTANVYHEGPDLQSGDAHALASRPPKPGVRDRTRTCMMGICNPLPRHSATHVHTFV